MREIHSRICERIRAFLAFAIAIPALLNHAAAQVATNTFVQVTGPALAFPGEQISFCFQQIKFNYTAQSPQNPADVGHSQVPEKPQTATLRLLDAITGIVVAQKDVTFPVAGSPALPSDPCVDYTIPATADTGAVADRHKDWIGVVSISGQPLPPGAAPNSSFDIFTPVFGFPTNVRHIAPGPTCPTSSAPCVY